MNGKGVAVAIALLVSVAACEKSAPLPESKGQTESADAPSQVGFVAPSMNQDIENSPQMFSGDFLSGDIVASNLCAIRANNIPLSKNPTTISDKTSVVMHGWLGDEQTMAWPSGAVLYIQKDGERRAVWSVVLPDPTARGDVARNFNSETMRNTGFDVTKNLTALPPGNYRLVLGFEKDGKQYRCDRSRLIQLI